MSQSPPERGELRPLSRAGSWGSMLLERAIANRRSVRDFEDTALTERELSQLLWAIQGVTGDHGLRAAPSAGALYPLEIYVATASGLYHYEAELHAVTVARTGDLRPAMCRASLDQTSIRQAPAVFVITAVYARTAVKYGEQWSQRFVDMEIGHAAQNLLLQAVAMDLGGVPIAAFHEDRIQRVLRLPVHEEPRYLVPVGQPR